MSDKPPTNVYEALFAVRQEFPTIIHNQKNPHFGSTYADLGAILAAVEPVLVKHRLVLVQTVERHFLLTSLVFLDADPNPFPHGLSCTYPLPDEDNPQKFGSALTYARRYSISTLLGLVTEKDDDGNSAAAPAAAPEPEPVPDGWESEGAAQAAHRAVADRVKALEAAGKDVSEIRKAKDAAGWPMSREALGNIEAMLTLLETSV